MKAALSAEVVMAVMMMVTVLVPPLSTADGVDNSGPHYLNSFAVQVDGGLAEAQAVAYDLGFSVERELPHIGVFLLEHPTVTHRSKRSADKHVFRLKSHPKVRYVQQEIELSRVKRSIIHDKQVELPIREIKDNSVFHREELQAKSLRNDIDQMTFNDPCYRDMWYLKNRGQSGGEKYLDMNVQVAWANGFTGEGVVVCILDDGVDHTHPDLTYNFDPKASADLNDKLDKMNDPMPNMANPGNSHGTRCAGEIAAMANNNVCGVGVAYNAKIGGIRMLDGKITDSLEGEALAFNRDYVHIYSASWGPSDNGHTMEAPNFFARQSLMNSVLKGRGGLGNIFVWATGNGGMNQDDCNADGYTSSIETLSVGSITDRGRQPFYMENCTSTLAVVPTGGEEYRGQEADMGQIKLKVVTTDTGGGCIENFQGTSSAAPLAAGCIANVLQANPMLTWRDIQHVVVHGTRITSVDSSWIINGAGHHVSHKFGFGLMDCGKMVQVAQSWHNVPEQHVCQYHHGDPIKIRYGSTISDKMFVNACKEDYSKWIQRLEHVQVQVKMNTRRRGDIQIFLISPSGTRSELLSRRPSDSFKGYWEFTFMTVHSWDENPAGRWELEVYDKARKESQFLKDELSEFTAFLDSSDEDRSGYLQEWTLTLYGTAGERYSRGFSSKQTLSKAYHPSEEDLKRMKRDEVENSRNVHVKRANVSKQQDKRTRVKSQISDETIDQLARGLSKFLKHEHGRELVKRILEEENSGTAEKKEKSVTATKKSHKYRYGEEKNVDHSSDALRDKVVVKVLRSLERLLVDEEKGE